MLKLPNITLVSIDCVDPVMAYKALKYSGRHMEFAEVALFTSKQTPFGDVTVHEIEDITNLADYSLFCIKKLADYITTDFMITVHSDGFIINPHLWRSEFLDYDYIGAPWSAAAPWCVRNRVGNGGFSLRSRKFMELAQKLDISFRHEDVLLTNICYDHFIEKGCKYAPVEVAMRFALESRIPECDYNLNNCFGFHGKGEAFYHQGEGGQFKERIALLNTVDIG
jgi:hypothetical protein